MICDTSTLLEPVDDCDLKATREAVAISRSQHKRASEAPEWIDRGQIPGLDGLRAIAVLLVLLVHGMQTPGFPTSDWVRQLVRQGHIGVDIFFVISGFLITTLLARELERKGRINLKRFYVRRTLRIAPVYCAYLAVAALCQYAGEFSVPSEHWICALTYTTNFIYPPSWELGHTWSLSVEEHFYLVWPIVLFVAGLTGGWRMAVGCVLGCWILRCSITFVMPHVMSHSDTWFYSNLAENCTLTRMDTISMGCLLALASRSDYWRSWLNYLTPTPMMIVYLLTIGVALQMGRFTKFHLVVYYTLTGVCIALLIWGAIRDVGLIGRVLRNPVLVAIGVGSYSIYLWQQLLLHPRQPGWIHAFPQNVFLALGVACVSYWLIERPLSRLKDRVAA